MRGDGGGAGTGDGAGAGMDGAGPSRFSAPGPIRGKAPGAHPGANLGPAAGLGGVDAKITFAPPSAEHLPGLTVDSDAIGRMFEEEQTRQAEALVAARPERRRPGDGFRGFGDGVLGARAGRVPRRRPRRRHGRATHAERRREQSPVFEGDERDVHGRAHRRRRVREPGAERTRIGSSEPETNPGAERTPVESVADAAVAEEEEGRLGRERAKARAAEAAAEIAASSSASTTSVKAMFAARVAKEAVGSARGSEKAVGSASGPSGTETNGARKSTLPLFGRAQTHPTPGGDVADGKNHAPAPRVRVRVDDAEGRRGSLLQGTPQDVQSV